MDEKKISDITRYTLKLIDQTISSDEFDELNSIISADSQAARYYNQLMMTAYNFQEIGKELISDESAVDNALQKEFWKSLAEYEKKAPEIQFLEQEPQRELIQKVVYPPREKQKISKLSIFTLVNVAAVILFFVILRFAPSKGGVEVATLTDSLNAKWADLTLSQGTRLKSDGSPLMLREGMAELLFDNNTKIVLEAPVEFELVSKEQIYLRYGRLYATVPVEGVGFSVDTSNSRVIDLGTEFGINADMHGNTFLHVTKGKTVLIAGDKKNKKTAEVTGGNAKKVSAYSQEISDIKCNDRRFVRDINSASNLIWRGERELSLADIVAGGNGFGTVHSLVGIDPGTGRYSPINWRSRSAKYNYNLVSDSKFVDGVFVPDGGSKASIVISSANDTFQCPDTTGQYTYGIAVCTGDIETLYVDDINAHQDSIPQAVFEGHQHLNDEIVMIHSNAGITFDLEAIRQLLPGLDLTHFKAFGGITEAMRNTKTSLPEADFWLLVDGQIRYEKKALTVADGKISFDVELNPKDRFLTLIVTDGFRVTEAVREFAAWNNDFFYLIDPILYIESALD